MEIDFDATSLKSGNSNIARTMAIKREIKESNIDSLKNWMIIWTRRAPTVLRKPTSFARLDESAVDKFIKLMQAINSIKNATREKIVTYVPFPCPSTSSMK